MAVVEFCKYMKRNAIRGYFRIDIKDIGERELDNQVDIVELLKRNDFFESIFNCMMRDRNEAFFYCSIVWLYYRFRDKMPHRLNNKRKFEFVMLNKAYRMARKFDYKYFVYK